MAAISVRRSQLAIVAAAALAIAAAVAALAGHDPAAGVTTYAATSSAARALDLAAGLGLLGAGLLAGAQRRTSGLGVLALMAATAWFAADIDGWERGPSVLRSLGAPAALLLAPVLLHLALALPGRRLPSGAARVATAGAYGLTAAVALGLLLLRDPLLDVYCWRNCRVNAFLVDAQPGLARELAVFGLACAGTTGLVIVAVGAIRLASATRPARRVLAPGLVPAMLAGGAELAYALGLLRTPLEDPASGGFRVLFGVRAIALGTLALGIGWTALRVVRMRARVSRLAAELGEAPQPGKLAAALGTAVGDPTLEFVYPLAAGRFVDAGGNARANPGPRRGRAVTRIARRGRTVALVDHDATLVGEGALEREIGAAGRLAVENEALGAEGLAQLVELRASRARIVATGDAARLRMERDLHDGAQQQVVAALFELERVRTTEQANGDDAGAAFLASIGDEIERGLGDLRELAQGLYPVVLTDGGLHAALTTLADTAPIAVEVEVGSLPPARLEHSIEVGAYLTISEAVRDAAERGATFVAIEAARTADRLTVSARDDGVARIAAPVHIADRIGALGGSLRFSQRWLRAEIPCG
jgi:signal transduction histidine kinase